MIPILIVSINPETVTEYVEKFKKNGQYYDVIPTGKQYSIEDIRNIIKETKIYFQSIRTYFFSNFQESSIPAQNSFLKLLEEPPNQVQFILSINNLRGILPTIASRCKIINLNKDYHPLLDKNIHNLLEDFMENKNLKILSCDPFNQLKRDDSVLLFNQMIYFFRKRLADDKNSSSVIKEIMRVKSLLESNNLNPQLAVDQTLIFISKQYKMNLI